MRVFVTGASGHIGSAVVPELLAAGHQVTGLARSDSSAATLEAWGAAVRRGTLDDLDILRSAASERRRRHPPGVQARGHAVGRHGGAVAADLSAVETMLDALAGTGKPFVGTSGTLMLAIVAPGKLGTEDGCVPRRPADRRGEPGHRDGGPRGADLRHPSAPTVHSSLDHHGFVPTLIGIARATGVAGYVGNGANRWPAGHTLDAAHLYRLALEEAPAGSRLHAVGDEGVPFKEIAEAIGRNLELPVESITPEEATAHFSFLGDFVQLDNPTSSELTRKLLGWEPTHAGLIADLDEGHYFNS